MAAAKKKSKKRRYHVRRYRLPKTPEGHRYLTWTHDFDTVVHGMVRNPEAIKMTPAAFVAKAAGIAEEMRKLQDDRRPKDVDPWR
jgi:hypothetical protein